LYLDRGSPGYSIDEARAWYEIAAEMGSPSATSNLGTLYRDAGDVQTAITLFTRAGEAGNGQGWSNLAWIYGTTRYGLLDRVRSFQLHTRAYETGYLEAAIDLSSAFQYGWAIDGTVKDPQRAVGLLVEAGERGCTTCWAAAAGIYTTDALGPPSPETAFLYYDRGAQAGDPVAVLEAGRALAAGRGTQQDRVRALAYYERSAALGNVEAKGALGRALARGEGAARDAARAEPLLREMMRLDASDDPDVRHQVYAPNYWGFGLELANLIEDGLVQPRHPDELAELRARYGARDGDLKRFTVPVTCGDLQVPFHVYVRDWDRPNDETPIDDQAAWLEHQRGCTMSADVIDSFRRLKVIARENTVDYTDLTVYALNAAQGDLLRHSAPAETIAE
jgi:uncharacterized protein